MRRLAAIVLCGLALLAMPAPAAAEDGMEVALSTPSARPGTVIQVSGSGWPYGKLIQLVTCGELAIPGSAACDMRQALATSTRDNGTWEVALTVGDPPRPCPCVVHVALVGVGADGHVDAPLEIPGHAVGPTPARNDAAARIEVVEARLIRHSTVGAWFGGVQHPTLVYTFRNAGPQPLRGVPLHVQVGRRGNQEDQSGQSKVDLIQPGETRTVELDVTIPFAAFGRYAVHVDAGGLGAAEVGYDAYPWGLVLANAAGLGLIAFGLLHRRRRRLARPAPTVEALLPAVVRLPELNAYLVFDDAPGTRRLRRLGSRRLASSELRTLLDSAPERSHTAVVDLEALDALLEEK